MPDQQRTRRAPHLPPPGQRIRLLVDTDAATEVDDQYAISLAALSPERFDIEGFVGSHLGDQGGPEGPAMSAAEIETVLDKAGLAGAWPVKLGADPLRYSAVPSESEGVDFIIERAMAGEDGSPLWIVVLGPITDVASAWLKCPEIARRVVVLYHARTQYWPEKAWNCNVIRDLKAARCVFASALPLAVFDTGTYLYASVEDTARHLAAHGPLGAYLHEIRCRHEWTRSPGKAFFDLGEVACLLDGSLVYSEVTEAPTIDWDCRLDWRHTHGPIRRVYQIDRDRTFDLLYRKFAEKWP